MKNIIVLLLLLFMLGIVTVDISAQEVSPKSIDLKEIVEKKTEIIRKLESNATKLLFSELLSLDMELISLSKKNREDQNLIEAERMTLILQTLNLVEKVQIKDFDFTKNIPLVNVCPPDKDIGENVIYMCGMDPKGIKDSIKRKRYEDAIEENKRIGEKRGLQRKVRKIKKLLHFQLNGYSETFDKDEFSKLINEYIETGEVQQELIEKFITK